MSIENSRRLGLFEIRETGTQGRAEVHSAGKIAKFENASTADYWVRTMAAIGTPNMNKMVFVLETARLNAEEQGQRALAHRLAKAMKIVIDG